jgi:hypothetical protein
MILKIILAVFDFGFWATKKRITAANQEATKIIRGDIYKNLIINF